MTFRTKLFAVLAIAGAAVGALALSEADRDRLANEVRTTIASGRALVMSLDPASTDTAAGIPAAGTPAASTPGTAPQDVEIVAIDDALFAKLGVAVGPVGRRVLSDLVRAPGEVMLDIYSSAKVTSRIPAQIVKRRARMGEHIKKGQAIVTLSSVEMAQGQADLVVAKAEWQRVQGLGKKVVSERRYVAARAAYQQARSRVLAYGMTARQIEALLGDNGPEKADGTFDLLSPRAGTIVSDNFVEGEFIEPGRVLFEIADLGTVWVEARLSPEGARRVTVGMPAAIETGKLRHNGRVVQIHQVLDDVTRTRAVRISVDNPDGALQPGEFVDVLISAGSKKLVLAVPDKALVLMNGGPTVFKREAAGLRPVSVTVGQNHGGWTEITAGLTEGDAIAITGLFGLKSLILKEKMGGGHGD